MQLLINALIAGSFAALMASGLSLVYGTLGIFNMALGQFALLGGYVTWWFFTALGLPFTVSFILSIAITAITSWISFEIFVAPYYRRQRFLPLVTTIALSMVMDGLLLILFHEEPHTIAAGSRALLRIGTGVISMNQFTLISLTLLFLAGLAAVLGLTRFGRSIRATVQHSQAAESLGIRSGLLHRIVFVLSGVLAGCAGVYLAIDQNLTPTMGFAITIKAYAAIIAGGKRSLSGAILCAYIIALLEQLAIGIPWFGSYIPAGYQSTVALIAIIVVLLVKPEGIFGSKLRTA